MVTDKESVTRPGRGLQRPEGGGAAGESMSQQPPGQMIIRSELGWLTIPVSVQTAAVSGESAMRRAPGSGIANYHLILLLLGTSLGFVPLRGRLSRKL